MLNPTCFDLITKENTGIQLQTFMVKTVFKNVEIYMEGNGELYDKRKLEEWTLGSSYLDRHRFPFVLISIVELIVAI